MTGCEPCRVLHSYRRDTLVPYSQVLWARPATKKNLGGRPSQFLASSPPFAGPSLHESLQHSPDIFRVCSPVAARRRLLLRSSPTRPASTDCREFQLLMDGALK